MSENIRQSDSCLLLKSRKRAGGVSSITVRRQHIPCGGYKILSASQFRETAAKSCCCQT